MDVLLGLTHKRHAMAAWLFLSLHESSFGQLEIEFVYCIHKSLFICGFDAGLRLKSRLAHGIAQ